MRLKNINENNLVEKWCKKKILNDNKIDCDVIISNVDEDGKDFTFGREPFINIKKFSRN